MCLIVKSFPRTARRNKTVYKLLRYNIQSFSFESPYRGTPVSSKIMSDDGAIDEQISFKSRINSILDGDSITIYHGIHSFKNLSEAKLEMGEIHGFIIVECVIPRKSRYVYGRMSTCDYKNYVSDRLILKSVVASTLHGENEHYMNIKFDTLKNK